MRTILLSLAMLAAVATAAGADINVWWQLDSGDGVAMDQGEGKTLVIGSPSAAPNGSYYEYGLSMWISTDGTEATTNGCRAYRSNIWRGSDSSMTMEGDPLAGLLNPLGWTGTFGYEAASVNNGDFLIHGYGRANRLDIGETIVWQGNSPLKVITMTLRIARDHFDTNETHRIWESVAWGMYGWLPAVPPTLNKVVFGPNSWV